MMKASRGRGEVSHGFVLGTSAALVMMHVFNDFLDDGYAVIPVVQVKKVRSGKFERASERILESEELWPGNKSPPRISLESLPAALRSLQNSNTIVWVEHEPPNADDIDYYIGRIRRVSPSKLVLHNYDGTYRWDAGLSHLPMNEITAVSFHTPYIRITERYVRKRVRRRKT
jgi:hypothetical protein